jgi:acetyl esterase/lipase
MKKKFYVFMILITLAASVSLVRGQQTDSMGWVDHAAGEYDIFPNITYATASNMDLKLDLYLPKNRTKVVPVLILYHGGGWVDGAKERNVFYLLPYLAMGWAVINVEYRMAKNALAPAAVEDSRCALRWAVYKAKEYNFDTNKFVTTGTSAGAHLALMAAMLPAGNVFDRQCPTTDGRWNSPKEPEVKVAAVINYFGITDVAELIEGPNAKHYAMEWLGSRSDRLDLAKRLSPLEYLRSGGPAVLTFHGDKDDVVPYTQAVRLHEGLDKAGVPNRLLTFKGLGHGGYKREDFTTAMTAMREFLKKVGVLTP